jgi:cardiolipin synthase
MKIENSPTTIVVRFTLLRLLGVIGSSCNPMKMMKTQVESKTGQRSLNGHPLRGSTNFSLLLAAVLTVLLGSCGSPPDQAPAADSYVSQSISLGAATVNLGETAFRATVVAALRQPVTSTRTALGSVWHRSRGVMEGNLPLSMSLNTKPDVAPGSEAFERFLDRQGLPARELGQIECLVDGPEFFGELDRQLTAAKDSVDVQVYIFDNDDIGVRYARKFAEKSHRVPVRVMFDDLGTNTAMMSAPQTLARRRFSPPKDMKKCIQRGSRVEVRRTLNPLLVADHTKLFVFDDKSAILGGMNIGREYYSEWHDMMVLVKGPVVGSLAREFQSAWGKAGPWGDFSVFGRGRKINRPKAGKDDVPVRILRTGAAQGLTEVMKASVAAIHGSRKRVWIETPYFASDQLVRAAQEAACRGVDVRVIFPGKNDSALMGDSNLETARQLLLAGVKVYHYPGMTHLKAMICDDWALVGSANFDILSMRLNRELNLAFSDRHSVGELSDSVFLPDFERSRRIKLEDTKSPTSRIAELLADQL